MTDPNLQPELREQIAEIFDQRLDSGRSKALDLKYADRILAIAGERCGILQSVIDELRETSFATLDLVKMLGITEVSGSLADRQVIVQNEIAEMVRFYRGAEQQHDEAVIELSAIRALLGPERCVWRVRIDHRRAQDCGHAPTSLYHICSCLVSHGHEPRCDCHPFTPEPLADSLRRVMGERLSDTTIERLAERIVLMTEAGAGPDSIADAIKQARGTSATSAEGK